MANITNFMMRIMLFLLYAGSGIASTVKNGSVTSPVLLKPTKFHVQKPFWTISNYLKKVPRKPLVLLIRQPRRILEISTASSSLKTGTALLLCIVAMPFTLVPVYCLTGLSVALPKPVLTLLMCAVVSRPAGTERLGKLLRVYALGAVSFLTTV
jgi:hypothetical protein